MQVRATREAMVDLKVQMCDHILWIRVTPRDAALLAEDLVAAADEARGIVEAN